MNARRLTSTLNSNWALRLAKAALPSNNCMQRARPNRWSASRFNGVARSADPRR